MIKTVWCITFFVSDLDKSAKFYEETLGLEKKYRYASYVGFECGGVEIGLVPKLSEQSKVNRMSPSVTFLTDDVEKSYGELKKRGVKFIDELHEETWGGRQATFADPDGNIIEIAQINWKKYYEVSAKGAHESS